jgi:long-subunit acyl-CoA synthetase (AMP-forming)
MPASTRSTEPPRSPASPRCWTPDHRAPLDERHLSSAGRPLASVEVAIIDSLTGKAAKAGEVGEVRLRGEQVMAGNWRLPTETTAALLPDGWLRTGDAGYLDDAGYLFVVDRIKNMIISGEVMSLCPVL